jgi:hypothetical protein
MPYIPNSHEVTIVKESGMQIGRVSLTRILRSVWKSKRVGAGLFKNGGKAPWFWSLASSILRRSSTLLPFIPEQCEYVQCTK